MLTYCKEISNQIERIVEEMCEYYNVPKKLKRFEEIVCRYNEFGKHYSTDHFTIHEICLEEHLEEALKRADCKVFVGDDAIIVERYHKDVLRFRVEYRPIGNGDGQEG